MLFAGYKGDIHYYVESAFAIDRLTEQSRVLIAEACTHAPLTEDIGRVKIPHLLRKRTGEGLQIDIVSGNDFPEDLSPYNLIIHCGACMFNRKYVLSRIEQARAQQVPMTNYGVAMEDFYRAIGMPVSICELIGRQATDEEIKLMTDKCSSGGSATTGNLKVLHRDDMKNIYRMANR